MVLDLVRSHPELTVIDAFEILLECTNGRNPQALLVTRLRAFEPRKSHVDPRIVCIAANEGWITRAGDMDLAAMRRSEGRFGQNSHGLFYNRQLIIKAVDLNRESLW